MSDEQTNSFSFAPLGEKWWRDTAASCTHKPSEIQLRFAGRHDGLNATEAARRAGYSGDGKLRGAGSRVLKSTSVQELLAYAFAETGTGDDGVVKGGEARRILSRIARTGDNGSRIKALDSLARIDREEKELKRATEQRQRDPIDELRELHAIMPELAEVFAAHFGIHWNAEMAKQPVNESGGKLVVKNGAWVKPAWPADEENPGAPGAA